MSKCNQKYTTRMQHKPLSFSGGPVCTSRCYRNSSLWRVPRSIFSSSLVWQGAPSKPSFTDGSCAPVKFQYQLCMRSPSSLSVHWCYNLLSGRRNGEDHSHNKTSEGFLQQITTRKGGATPSLSAHCEQGVTTDGQENSSRGTRVWVSPLTEITSMVHVIYLFIF